MVGGLGTATSACRASPRRLHHVVFTTPHELNPLWQYNQRLFCQLLFRAVADSLAELLADPQFLGARPGILAALHTWNQQLLTHIHIHAIVTAGGLDAQGNWRKATRECLLPRQVLMIKFRGKFRAFLLEHLEKLKLPAGTTVLQWRNQLNRLGRLPWNVKLMERYEHGRGVINYLARYLRGGPIGNKRLLGQADGKIAFRYRLPADYGQRAGHSVLRLHPHDFLKRLLQHVPPSGLRTVRGYGLYSGNQHSGLDQAHQQLGSTPPVRPLVPLSVDSFLSRLGIVRPKCCPQCGQPLVQYELGTPGRRALGGARSPPADSHCNSSFQVPA